MAHSFGRRFVGDGRRDPDHRDGAPLEHRALAAALRADRRELASGPDRRRRRAGSRGVRAAARTAHPAGRRGPHLQRAGHAQPVARIIDRAHANGAPVLVDGAQAVAHEPVDVRDLDCDFFAFSGHKMFGPTGIGVLYGQAGAARGDAALPRRRRDDPHGHASRGRPTRARRHRFEAGTPDIAGAIGLGAAVDYLDRSGWTASPRHDDELLDYATGGCTRSPGCA